MERCSGIRAVAIKPCRREISAVERSGVGICGSGGNGNAILDRRVNRHFSSEFRRPDPEDRAGRFLSAKQLRSVRHGWECMAVGRRLFSSKLRWSALRRRGVVRRRQRRLLTAYVQGRELVSRRKVCAVGKPGLFSLNRRSRQWRVQGCPEPGAVRNCSRICRNAAKLQTDCSLTRVSQRRFQDSSIGKSCRTSLGAASEGTSGGEVNRTARLQQVDVLQGMVPRSRGCRIWRSMQWQASIRT